jgi:hypothetical protein
MFEQHCTGRCSLRSTKHDQGVVIDAQPCCFKERDPDNVFYPSSFVRCTNVVDPFGSGSTSTDIVSHDSGNHHPPLHQLQQPKHHPQRTHPHGKQKYKCKNCGRYATLEPTTKYTPEQREYILAAYQERSSMRGIQRVHGVSRNTLKVWLKKRQPVAS